MTVIPLSLYSPVIGLMLITCSRVLRRFTGMFHTCYRHIPVSSIMHECACCFVLTWHSNSNCYRHVIEILQVCYKNISGVLQVYDRNVTAKYNIIGIKSVY